MSYSSQLTAFVFQKNIYDSERRNGPALVNFTGAVENTRKDETSEMSTENVPMTPTTPVHANGHRANGVDGSNGPAKEKPLLNEIREVMALSYLSFLLCDLRHMSATGRISIKYENLATDSDLCNRGTAKSIACTSDNVDDDENKQVGLVRGLSPALIMAIVILEIRDEAVKTAAEKKKKKKKKYFSEADIDNHEQFVGYENNLNKKKLTEESMESLMKCYSRLVSEDLVSEIPNVQKRRENFQKKDYISKSTGFLSPPHSSSFKRFTRSASAKMPFTPPISRGNSASKIAESSISSGLGAVMEDEEPSSDGFAKEVEKGRNSVEEEAPDASAAEETQDPPDSSFLDERQSQEIASKSTKHMFSPSKWSSFKNSSTDGDNRLVPQPSFREQMRLVGENSKQIAEKFKNDLNEQVEDFLTTDTEKEYKELTNAFFEQGTVNEEIKAELGATYSRKELVEVIRKSIESRDDNQLQFLSKFFKSGSISRLMAESHARIVWVNDWYPEKDLTYAISVDPIRKMVMVVFRGAITATDWRTTLQYSLEKIPNPVKDDYEGKKKIIRVYSGFYNYLFRKRKDTGTTKYDEICNLVHKYGIDRIGPDYGMYVTGHSLGGALANLFCFFASTDERFTKYGPVKAIGFACPYMGGHSWADAFRHQERQKKLQLVIVRNSNDVVPRMPPNFALGRRGPLWRHVGVNVTLPTLPRFGGKWKPFVHYWGKEKSFWSSTMHLYRRNFIFHAPWLHPWNLSAVHTLFELQDRLIYGEMNTKEDGEFQLFNCSVDELYDRLEETDFQTLAQTKWWGLHRKKGGETATNASGVENKK